MNNNQSLLRRIDLASFVKAFTFFSIIMSFIMSLIFVIFVMAFNVYTDQMTVMAALIIVVAAPAAAGFYAAIFSSIGCLIFNYTLKVCGGIKFNAEKYESDL